MSVVATPHARETIWTEAAYELLYEQLVRRFGPYKTWLGQRPANRDEFEQFCATFAEVVGAKSAEAVKMQIRFAVGIDGPNEHRWRQGQARTAILNMAAAFHAGFIDNSHFPDLTARSSAPAPSLEML
jgi:hypothetical protein